MTPILPGATLGVMGGGQLGRMFVHAAQQMGYATAVLDPDAASPAGCVSHRHVQAPYLDAQGLAQLVEHAAAITTEFENVPARALAILAERRPVAPGAQAVAVCQHRAAEKAQFARCDVPTAPYAVIETAAQLAAIDATLLPGILKTSSSGYDGKGQVRVNSAAELQAGWQQLGSVPCVLEKRLALACELSVVVARSAGGGCVHFPPQRNLHRDGILAVTEAPASGIDQTVLRQAVAAAERIAQAMDYVGVLCIEFFVLDDGSLVANEMAPRPHNSGHYTIDACDVSQFDLQVRTLASLPLAMPRQHSPAVMLNLLGDLWLRDGQSPVEPPWDRVVALPGAHLHLYGKSEPRCGRKMGHLTLTAAGAAQARATALRAAALLGIEAF
jgi:5-(carboxyamino)imidazole ribonucleotide synthase